MGAERPMSKCIRSVATTSADPRKVQSLPPRVWFRTISVALLSLDVRTRQRAVGDRVGV